MWERWERTGTAFAIKVGAGMFFSAVVILIGISFL